LAVKILPDGVTKLGNEAGSLTNFPPKLPKEMRQAGRFMGGIFYRPAVVVDAFLF